MCQVRRLPVFFPTNRLDEFSAKAERITLNHAAGGELKSSRIGSNIGRRERILKEVREAGFPIYCLAVDKNRIWRDSGLRFRKPFYKFLHRIFYGQIAGSFPSLNVLADQYGRSDFMESFADYIRDRSPLLNDFRFEPSSSVPLLQIADLVAGSVRRSLTGDDPHDVLKAVGYSDILIDEWPPALPASDEDRVTSETDLTIMRAAMEAARRYVEENIGSNDEEDEMRARAIRYLICRYEQDPEEYVFRSEIVDSLERNMGVCISEQTLSTKVLADARDKGVILASTERGVKIPYGAADLRAWMERTESQVAPYLRRVAAARRCIMLASHHEHDIADPKGFPELSRYLSNHRVSSPAGH
jgi:hypothetical protein